jgi:alpha-glucosidase
VHKGAIVGLQGGTARVRRAVEQLKAAGVPLAAVWLSDWVGQRPWQQDKQLWWSWQLDEEHYPGWAELRADLERDGIRVLTYVNPMLVDIRERDRGHASAALRRNFFAEARQSGYLVRTPSGEPYLLRHADFSAGLVDLTNPAAHAWFLDVLRDHVLAVGASGWMADSGELLPYDAVLSSGQQAASFHNQYPDAWARLNREAIERSRAAIPQAADAPAPPATAAAAPGSELLVFMRAGYSQSPRYATLFWLGDQLVTWDEHDGIKSSVIGLLSGGLSGFTLNHGDVGGHTSIKNSLMSYRREKELLLRWMELGALSPVFRTQEGSSPSENAQFDSDEQTLAHLSRCARLFAAWAPYRKALVREAAETGLPVARHLFLHYPKDPVVRGLSHQEFLLGTELLAAPVLDPGVRKLSVYLPAGTWVHVWSGTAFDAGSGRTVTIDAPLGQPGLFYKQGSAVGQSLVVALREQGLLTGQ